MLLVVAGGFGSSGSTNLIASESLGISAPFNFEGDGDNPDVFYRDIIETGGGLSDPALARIIADEACDRVSELIEMGVSFDADGGRIVAAQAIGVHEGALPDLRRLDGKGNGPRP